MAKKRGSNEGSIFKRKDGRWCAVINLGWENGKRQRKQFYGATRQEVAKALNKAIREKQQGLLVASDRQTVEQYLAYWLQHQVQSSVRPRTYESYELLSRVHIVPELGRLSLQELSPQHVQAFLAKKLKSGRAPQTVRHMRTVLRRALNFAIKWGLVSRNSAALVDPPRVERHQVRSLTSEQARSFLNAAHEERLGSLYVVSLSLGMRQGEVLGLRWIDVDIESENPTLMVNQALQRIKSEFQFVEPKTERSRRTIALPKSVVKTLLAHRRRQAAERLAYGPAWQDHGLIFTSLGGSPIERRALHRDFKRILAKAELPESRFHDLRHSAASLLLAQGVPMRSIMELLGHSSITLTADTYSHLMAPALRETADKMDEILTIPDQAKQA
jgi:integrase